MTGSPIDQSENGSSARQPYRWGLAAVFTLLAIVGAIGSVVGQWSHGVLFDTDSWVETVGPIGTSPEVTGALSDAVARELNEFLDPVGRLTEALPDALAPLGEFAGEAIENTIEEETREFFQSELYAKVWVELNRRGHTAVVAFVRDQVPFFSTADGVVSVDLEPLLSPIVDRVVIRIEELGEAIPDLLLDRVEFDDALANLISDYQAEGFPEHLNDVVVYRSDRLATVQQTVAVFDRLVVVLPIFTLLVAAAAIVAAPDRLLMLPVLLLGVALAWLGSVLVVNAIIANIIATIASANAAEVAGVLLNAITSGLSNLLIVLLIAAGVSGIAATAGLTYFRRRESSAS